MQSIKITPEISAAEFDSAAKIWLNTSDCEILFPRSLSEAEIHHLHALATHHIPSDFAFCVLESLAEFKNTPDEVLRQILNTGERSCIESVCMRHDLPIDLREVCGQIAQHKQA